MARSTPGKVVLVLTLVIPALLAGCGEAPAPVSEVTRDLRVIRLGDVSEFTQRAFPGRAAALQEVNLAFRVGGPLIARPVKVGDKVDVGDVVAQIDPNDFEVARRTAQGELDRAKAELKLAEVEYQRALDANAINPQLISRSELDRRLSGRDRSRADVDSLTAAVQAARDELGYASLKAPFRGTIVSTYVENFETVQSKQPIVRILDTTRIEFKIDVPETLISQLPTVQDIMVRFDAFPDLEIPGEVKEVGGEASETTRTYPVTLIMDQPAGREVLPGMAGTATGRAVAPTETVTETLTVPVNAVFSPEAGGTSYVWVVDEARQSVVRRQVSVGRLVTGGMEITASTLR